MCDLLSFTIHVNQKIINIISDLNSFFFFSQIRKKILAKAEFLLSFFVLYIKIMIFIVSNGIKWNFFIASLKDIDGRNIDIIRKRFFISVTKDN